MSTMTTNPHAGRGGGDRRKWKKGRKGRGGRGGRGGQGDEGSGNDGKSSTNSGKDAAVATKQATEEVVAPKMNNEIKQRRGKRDKRGRGGHGVQQEDERSGNGKKSSTNSSGEDAAVAPKQSKKEQKVATTPKMNNENNPPQAAGPPSARKTVSFGKNTNSVNLKNALKVGVETLPCSGSDNTTDQEMTSRGTDGADNIQTEKKEKTMQEKLKEVSNHINNLWVIVLLDSEIVIDHCCHLLCALFISSHK